MSSTYSAKVPFSKRDEGKVRRTERRNVRAAKAAFIADRS